MGVHFFSNPHYTGNFLYTSTNLDGSATVTCNNYFLEKVAILLDDMVKVADRILSLYKDTAG